MTAPRIYLSSPHMGTAEFEFVREAFATNWVAPVGPHVDAFEREFAALVGSPHACALASGTAALHLAMRLIGLQAGEEVMVSTLTFSASVNPILYEGGRPVFIDSERVSWNMDPQLLADALAQRAKAGRLPKAVILVHLYGQSADIDPIQALCDRYGVTLIEDAAEALGATYFGRRRAEDGGLPSVVSHLSSDVSPQSSAIGRQSSAIGHPSSVVGHPTSGITPGTRGRIGIYSFNGNKIITTSNGGMMVSADQKLTDKARFLATQARDPAPHYQHSEVGYNYRLSNVLAGIGRGQLQVLADRVNARRANAAYYQEALGDLPGLEFMPEAPWGRSTRWLTCITIDPAKAGTDREKVRETLAAQNIEARPVWKPMHLQPIFAAYDRFGGAIAEDLFKRGLCLPSGSNLSRADLERVVAVMRSCWRT